MGGNERDPASRRSKGFSGIRNFTNGVVDGVKRQRFILGALAGGAMVIGGEAVVHHAQSSPATISGVVVHVEPVPGVDDILANGVRIVAEPGFKVTLNICDSSKSIDIKAGRGTNNKDCHTETGFLTEPEINGKIKSLAEGAEVIVDSEAFFSLGEIRLNR